jgi:prevent-host-death family protein
MTILILENHGGYLFMKTMNITEFKAHALKVLSQIEKSKEPVLVTRRGKPVAEVFPYTEDKPEAGKLSETLVFENDIVSPLGGEMWNATR